MTTVICGSNRQDNKTFPFAKYAYDELVKRDENVRFLDLANLEGKIVSAGMYGASEQPKIIEDIQNEYFIPATKFWIFIPEYNGSYPGVVKVLIDTMSIRSYEETFKGKKVCLTGTASGRAGNLRGMDHLSEVLNHLGMHTHPNKKPISSIFKYIDKDGKLHDDDLKKEIKDQIDELIAF